MKCPFCSTLDSKVIDSRPANDGTSIRRRRECLQCHSRFTTYETVEMLPMVVIKKNGMRQSFDRSKLLSSMLKACEKRSVSLSLLEKAAAMREANAKAQTAKAEGGYTVTGEGDPAIDALVMQRYEAKKSKNFAEADRIRDELKAQGIEIVDTKDGASWKRV